MHFTHKAINLKALNEILKYQTNYLSAEEHAILFLGCLLGLYSSLGLANERKCSIN